MNTIERLRAGSIEIVDQEGNPRLVLAVTDGNPTIQMYDRDGQLRISLYIGPKNEPSLVMGMGSRNVNLLLYVDADGHPQIRLNHAATDAHVVLETSPVPAMTLHDRSQSMKISPSGAKVPPT